MGVVEVIFVIIGAVLSIAGITGVVLGQLRRGVIEELRASLASAKVEIDIANGKADRVLGELRDLRTEMSSMRAANLLLTTMVVSGAQLAPELKAAIIEALRDAFAVQFPKKVP